MSQQSRDLPPTLARDLRSEEIKSIVGKQYRVISGLSADFRELKIERPYSDLIDLIFSDKDDANSRLTISRAFHSNVSRQDNEQ